MTIPFDQAGSQTGESRRGCIRASRAGLTAKLVAAASIFVVPAISFAAQRKTPPGIRACSTRSSSTARRAHDPDPRHAAATKFSDCHLDSDRHQRARFFRRAEPPTTGAGTVLPPVWNCAGSLHASGMGVVVGLSNRYLLAILDQHVPARRLA